MFPRLLQLFILFSIFPTLGLTRTSVESPYAIPGRFIIKTKVESGFRIQSSAGSFEIGDFRFDVIEDAGTGVAKLLQTRGVISIEPDFYVYSPELEIEAARQALPVWCFFPDATKRFEECQSVKVSVARGVDTKEPPLLNPAPAVTAPLIDPYLKRQFSLRRVEGHNAWKYGKGSASFIVGIIDSGVDYNHVDLAANLWRKGEPSAPIGFDNLSPGKLPYDRSGHGTHVNGVIGAVGDNGIGISGVSPKVSLLNVRFLDANMIGTGSAAVKGVLYAVNHGAKVLNNSWGTRMPLEESSFMSEAIEHTRKKGALFVVAAGNKMIDLDSDHEYFPASFSHDNIVVVAATDRIDTLAPFSNYGVKAVHLAAPGVSVYSTLPKNTYGNKDGTSMATPFVSGAAALIWSQKPKLTYLQVKDILLKSAERVRGLKESVSEGRRLNVRQAAEY